MKVPKLKKRDWSNVSMAARPPKEETVRQLVATHLAILSHRMEPPTLRRRERCILYWVYFCESEGVKVAAATEEHALRMLEHWTGEDGWSQGSQRHFLVAVREFYDFLLDGEHASRNPWRRIRTRKAPKRVPRYLHVQEATRLANALNRPHWRDIRDRALILFLYATACRTCEVIGLDMRDLDLDNASAVVMGKGKREGYVFLAPAAVDALRVYLATVRPRLAGAGATAVFLGRHGGRIHRTVIRDAVIRATQRAGLDRHVNPHMLRHTAATLMKQAGADIYDVKTLLRHKDLSSTEVYTHVDSADARRAYERFHPLAQEVGNKRPRASRRPHRHLSLAKKHA